MTYTHKKPSLLQAFIPIIFLIVALFINVRIYGDSALDGSNQIILILSGGVAALVALQIGFKWAEIQKGIVKTISSAMASIIILLLIGSLAGTWLLSGIVPAMASIIILLLIGSLAAERYCTGHDLLWASNP